MAFCTQCGHSNPDEGRFCETCGHPMPKASAVSNSHGASQAALQAAPVMRIPARRQIFRIVGVAALVIAAMAGAAYVLMPESASKTNFANVINRELQKQPALFSEDYCLTNFAYDRTTVHVNPYNTGTERWLNFLSSAGLYSGPESVRSGQGFFSELLLKYERTAESAKFIRGKALCYADGLELKSVDEFTPAQKVGEQEFSKVSVTFALKNPAPWTQTDDWKTLQPQHVGDVERQVTMVLKEGKWQLATDATFSAAQKQQVSKSSVNEKSESLTGWFSKLFSWGNTNPLIGKWRPENDFLTGVSYEFSSDTMRNNGAQVKVRYEVKDGQVTVYPEGSPMGIVFRLIDSNTMVIDTPLAAMKLLRVR